MTRNHAEQVSSDKLITIASPRSPISEAYRVLRTNLQFASVDTELRTLLVSSPGPEEGKSTTLANLGVTLAQAEKRVILVDCDLRRPALHTFFGVGNELGLTNLILSEETLERPPLIQTAVPGLALLASGPLPPSPSDLLGSQRMERVIAALLDRADMLLFDAPPVMAATDATVLANKVDGVLLVVSAGQTKRETARRALERLQRVNAKIIGAVLNNVALDSSMQRYYTA